MRLPDASIKPRLLVPTLSVVLLALTGTAHGQAVGAAVDWKGSQPGFAYFRYEVLPLMRFQCGAGECHGGLNAGRLRLPPPLETGEYSNAAARGAYDAALPLVNADDRGKSLILLKPLRADGYPPGVPIVRHDGPKFVSPRADPDSPERMMYIALTDWIKGRRVANFTPYSFAGRDRVVAVGRKVVLDGSLSFDPNPDDRLRFQWSAVAWPVGAAPAIKGIQKPLAEFVPDRPGGWVFRLVVKDRTRTSEPAYVTIVADTTRTPPGPNDPDIRVDQRVTLNVAQAALAGSVKVEAAAAAPAGNKLVVPADAKTEGRAVFTVAIVKAGRYGLWVSAIDPGDASDAPVGIEIDGKLAARVPVMADTEWRTVRVGGVRLQTDNARAAGPARGPPGPGLDTYKSESGRWELDKDTGRLIAFGRGLGAAGINIADLKLAGDELTHVRAAIQATDKRDVRNGYIVFDYKGTNDYKFAGLSINPGDPAKSILEIDWIGGPRGKSFRQTVEARLVPNQDYVVTVKLNDGQATLFFDGRPALTAKFDKPFTGTVGLAGFQSETEFDGVYIWKNREFVFGDLAGRPPLKDDDAQSVDEPSHRLARHRPPSFRLTPGKHSIALLPPPGAAPIGRFELARVDPEPAATPEVRRTIRAMYLDVLGRPPTEDELDRDAAKPAGKLVRELTATHEFFARLYEDELLRLGLTENYRPVAEEEPEFHYPAIPARLATGQTTWRDATRALVYGVYFYAKNHGDEEYPTALWRMLFDENVLDDPPAFQAAQVAIGEPPQPAPPPPGAAVKKAAVPPPPPMLFGRPVRTREELIDACVNRPKFAAELVRRLHRTVVGLEPDENTVRTGTLKLIEAWNARREVIGELAVSWIESPRYALRLKDGRTMDDALFVRSAYVDLFGRAPDALEFRRLHRAITRADDPAGRAGLRAAAVNLMLKSDEADLHEDTDVPAWISRTLVRLLARPVKAETARDMAALLREAGGSYRLVVEAILTHPAYREF